MTAISVKKPYSLKTASVVFSPVGGTVGSFDFSSHINEAQFNPSSSTGTFTAVNGQTVSDVSASTWEVVFGLVQDLDVNGFMRWLQEHEGEKFKAEIIFANGTDACEIVVTVRASGMGGTANGNVLTSSVTLPADGKPEWQSA